MMSSTAVAKECLIIAADLIDNRSNTDYLSRLNFHTENFKLQHSIQLKPEGFDNFLYDLAERVWPKALGEISNRTNTSLS